MLRTSAVDLRIYIMALHLFITVLNLIFSCYGTDGRTILMNKMSTTVSDEFDCVDIYKQYALTHPALKDHKIQLKPSFVERLKTYEEEEEEDPSVDSFKFELKGPDCPIGKVPIQKKINHHNQSFHRFTKSFPGQHFAVVRNVENLTIHGVRGRLELRNNQLQVFQVSAAQLWVQNGPLPQLNSIQAGWEINPVLYGDSDIHLTAFWTIDNYGKTGCYNTYCPGFVQVYQRPVLGTTLQGSQYWVHPNDVDIMIQQDKVSGNWWLVVNGTVSVGYWPKELFPYLGVAATVVQYGGWTVNIPNSTSPPMGSGNFADSYIFAAYIKRMKLINGGYSEASPDFLAMGTYTDDSSCYTVIYNGYEFQMGHIMYYGGPGGSCTN